MKDKAEWDIPRVYTYKVIDLNESNPDKAIIWKKVTTERLYLSLITEITYPTSDPAKESNTVKL